MGNVFFAVIRHGEYQQRANTPSAHQPYPLNANGVAQAQASASRIIEFSQQYDLSIDACIDCSPLLRSWQTASVVAAELETLAGMSFVICSDACLTERCVGSVANLTIDEIEDLLRSDPRYDAPPPQWKSDSFYKLPFTGAESLHDSGRRVADYLESAATELQSKHQRVLRIVVVHGASFRHAVTHFGALTVDQVAQYSMHHCEPMLFEVVNHQQAQWQLVEGAWKTRQAQNQDQATANDRQLD